VFAFLTTDLTLYPFASTVVLFSHDTATTSIYSLSLHDALRSFLSPPLPLPPPKSACRSGCTLSTCSETPHAPFPSFRDSLITVRSEEHTSELQSREKLVCRLLLEKKNKRIWSQLHSAYL